MKLYEDQEEAHSNLTPDQQNALAARWLKQRISRIKDRHSKLQAARNYLRNHPNVKKLQQELNRLPDEASPRYEQLLEQIEVGITLRCKDNEYIMKE